MSSVPCAHSCVLCSECQVPGARPHVRVPTRLSASHPCRAPWRGTAQPSRPGVRGGLRSAEIRPWKQGSPFTHDVHQAFWEEDRSVGARVCLSIWNRLRCQFGDMGLTLARLQGNFRKYSRVSLPANSSVIKVMEGECYGLNAT